MSQVTEQSVRFQTALASIKLIQASAVLDLTEDDFDFLTSNKVWIATDRSFFFKQMTAYELISGDWSSDVCSSDLYTTFFFFKQKTAYEIMSGDWSSDVCSSDLPGMSRSTMNE